MEKFRPAQLVGEDDVGDQTFTQAHITEPSLQAVLGFCFFGGTVSTLLIAGDVTPLAQCSEVGLASVSDRWRKYNTQGTDLTSALGMQGLRYFQTVTPSVWHSAARLMDTNRGSAAGLLA